MLAHVIGELAKLWGMTEEAVRRSPGFDLATLAPPDAAYEASALFDRLRAILEEVAGFAEKHSVPGDEQASGPAPGVGGKGDRLRQFAAQFPEALASIILYEGPDPNERPLRWEPSPLPRRDAVILNLVRLLVSAGKLDDDHTLGLIALKSGWWPATSTPVSETRVKMIVDLARRAVKKARATVAREDRTGN